MRLLDLVVLGPITILQEAEGEPFDGKIAVGEVIRRRMKQKFWSDGTVEGTVLRPLQFSGWNGNAPNRLRTVRADDTDPVVQDCIRAWEKSTTSTLVPGATHYFSVLMADPYWAKTFRFVGQIGKHRFYDGT